MSADWQRRAVVAAASAIRDNAARLTELDAAIGDGDHGTNMKRGFEAAAEAVDEIAALPPGKALQKLGMTLVSKVGGASGPLYGSLFMAMGKALGDDPPAPEGVAAAFEEGVAAVKKRGKSEAGEKTMLDVLVPMCEALRQGLANGDGAPDVLARRVREAAEAGLARTRDLKATKGRAAYLGERSVGHLDPGAQSACLLAGAVQELFEESA